MYDNTYFKTAKGAIDWGVAEGKAEMGFLKIKKEGIIKELKKTEKRIIKCNEEIEYLEGLEEKTNPVQ